MWIWRTHLTVRSCFKNWEASKPRSEVKCKFHGLVRYNFGTFYLSVRYIFNYVFLFHSLLLLFVLIWLLQQIFCKVHNIKCSKIRNSCIIPNLKSNRESLIKFKENSFPRWQHTGSMTTARLQNLSDQSTTLKKTEHGEICFLAVVFFACKLAYKCFIGKSKAEI